MPDIFEQKEPKQIQNKAETEEAHASLPHPDEDAIRSVQKMMHGEKHSMGLLTAYGIRPKGISFANQEPDEFIILFLRRHFITNIPWIATSLFFSIMPPILFTLLQFFTISLGNFPAGLTFVLVGFYYLMIGSYAFGKFVSWFYNIGVITQKRLVDLDTSNILAHNTTAANFNELVDIKFTQRGFLQSFFDYGDIHIQTEAIRANFEYLAAPKPSRVVDIISDLRVATKGGKHHGAD